MFQFEIKFFTKKALFKFSIFLKQKLQRANVYAISGAEMYQKFCKYLFMHSPQSYSDAPARITDKKQFHSWIKILESFGSLGSLFMSENPFIMLCDLTSKCTRWAKSYYALV